MAATFSLTAAATADTGPSDPGMPAMSQAAQALGGKASERLTERWTRQYLDALERQDLAALGDRMRADVTVTQPITFSGNQEPDAVFEGKEAVTGYLTGLFGMMETIDFVDEQITVAAGGGSSFVQANGDFTTREGDAYRNVYVLHFTFDRHGSVVAVNEYANPLTYCQTFPEAAVC
ncbi:nuclear transport factor 2 family protein [Streptomyces sp. MP131-18]|uniref:nuclear transport factor 2 family protein n=1 Tax=Streptomyces sp. MP131-18 TaxID=1857892 RepID=UPI00097CABE0|nr:nuclear transport factor 2 family protein [Streptomyces sp. MP131-18]ONK13867.1 Ketosteroid isomerase-related protein [Streptomyces sp. MP131-18]